MAITYVGGDQFSTSGGINPVFNAPAGLAAGDCLVVFVSGGGSFSMATPAGWTLLAGGVLDRYNDHHYCFFKIAGASEPASYTFPYTGTSAYAEGELLVYRGVSQTSPIHQFKYASQNTGTASPTVTTVVDGCMILEAGNDIQYQETWSINSPYTLREAISNSGGLSGAAADTLQSTAGVSPSATFNESPTNAAGTVMWTVALTPATAPVSFVAGTAVSNPAINTSITVNKPAGVMDNDLLLMCVGWNSTLTLTLPAGWTAVNSPQTMHNAKVQWFYKWAKGEPGSYALTFSGGTQPAVYLAAYRNADPTKQFDYTSSNSGTGTSATIGSNTTSSNNELRIAYITATDPITITDPSGWTRRGTAASSNLIDIVFDDVPVPTAGNVPAVTASMNTSTSQPYATSNIAVISAAPAPTAAALASSSSARATASAPLTTHIPLAASVTASATSTATLATNVVLINSQAQGPDNGSNTSLTVTNPVGMQAGDLMLLSVFTANGGAPVVPVGWTLVQQSNNGFYTATFRKFASSSEPASWTFNNGGNAIYDYLISAYRGVDQTNPVQDVQTPATGNSAAPAITSYTTSVAGAPIAICGVGALSSYTAPGGWHKDGNSRSDGEFNYGTRAASSVVPATTFTDNSSGNWSAYAFTLKLATQAPEFLTGQAQATAHGALSTAIRLAASRSAAASIVSAKLLVPINLVAHISGAGAGQATVSLTTAIHAAAGAHATATPQASVQTAIRPAASVQAQATASGALTTHIVLKGVKASTISVRGTPTTGGIKGTSLAVNCPAGVQAGDLLLAFATTETSSLVFPSGWQQAATTQVDASGYHYYAYYKIVTATEPASYTFTDASSDFIGVQLIAYAGVDQGTPINASAGTTGKTPLASPPVTTTHDADRVVAALISQHGTNFTVSNGWTVQGTFLDATNGLSIVIADELLPAAGASGSTTFTQDANQATAIGIQTLALTPTAQVAPLVRAQLSTQLPLAVSLNARALGTAQLSTQLRPAASVHGQAQAHGALSTQIHLNGGGHGAATASLMESFFRVFEHAHATASGSLHTAIAVAAGAHDSSLGNAQLSTAIHAQAGAHAQAAAGAAFSTQIALHASSSAQAHAAAALTTHIPLAGNSSARTTSSSAFTTAIALRATGSAQATAKLAPSTFETDSGSAAHAQAQLTTAIILAASSQALALCRTPTLRLLLPFTLARVVTLAADDRTVSVPSEVCTVTVPPEARLLLVAADDRLIAS